MINLTQHVATAEQIAAGVVDAPDAGVLAALLTFDEVPTSLELTRRAAAVAAVAKGGGATRAMIGGAPFFMAPLEIALREAGIVPVFAFSRRESVEAVQPDGSVRKLAVFRHAGFVPSVVNDALNDEWHAGHFGPG